MELINAEIKFDNELFLEVEVMVRIYSKKFGWEKSGQQVSSLVRFQKKNNNYFIDNDADWMKRYEINSSTLEKMILKELELI